MVLVD
jgi:hypothetical protein